MMREERETREGRQHAWSGRTETSTCHSHAATMATTHEEQGTSEEPQAQNQNCKQAAVTHASYSCALPFVGAAHHETGTLLETTQNY